MLLFRVILFFKSLVSTKATKLNQSANIFGRRLISRSSTHSIVNTVLPSFLEHTKTARSYSGTINRSPFIRQHLSQSA